MTRAPGTRLPEVSVLLPVRNGGQDLKRAVDSILAQTLSCFELLIIDDGSSDGALEALQPLARRDPRIRIFRNPPCGLVAALKQGLAVARAPWIARMDADDRCHPERLQQQRDFLEGHPELGLVSCRVTYGGDRSSQQGYAHYVDWLNTLIDPEPIALNRFIESPLPHPSVMFRAALPQQHGSYIDGPFPEDYDLWLRWMEQGVMIGKVDASLLTWNDPPTRLSRQDPRYDPERFYQHKAGYLARWLSAHNPHHPDIVVWGSGRLTRKRAAHLEAAGCRISAYIDIKPQKIGQLIEGRPVWGKDQIPPPGEVFILPYVGSRGAREQIEAWLTLQGYRRGRDYICAA